VSYSYFDFSIDDLELTLLDLGVLFNKHHYETKVIKKEGEKVLLIYKERLFKDFIGTASVVGVRYFINEQQTGVEVFCGKLENTTTAALKEFIGDILILPLLARGFDLISMVKKAKKYSVLVAHKHKKEVKK
jgi:hypothetical protein